MKLIIQIPCYNEEANLGATLNDLPKALDKIDTIERLVINDGSDDRTVEVARTHGVDHVVDLPHHQGLARAFIAGIEASLAAGADIIVNTDADNQYSGTDIAALIEPIQQCTADIVIGRRSFDDIAHFSGTMKILSPFGSWRV